MFSLKIIFGPKIFGTKKVLLKKISVERFLGRAKACAPISHSFCPSVCQSVSQSIRPSISSSIRLSVSLSVRLYICLFVCLLYLAYKETFEILVCPTSVMRFLRFLHFCQAIPLKVSHSNGLCLLAHIFLKKNDDSVKEAPTYCRSFLDSLQILYKGEAYLIVS